MTTTADKTDKKGKRIKEHFSELSPVHACESCGKGIKKRLVRIKQSAPKKCYKCYKSHKKTRG